MAKKKERKSPSFSPIITLIILILIVMVASSILSILDIEGTRTTIFNDTLQNTIVVVKNIFSKEGIIHFHNNIFINFQVFEPLVLIIISLLAISIGKESGFFKHIFEPLKNKNPYIVTGIVVFIGIISSFIGEYSYIILIPLVAIMYQYLGRNPVVGILTMFLAITLGYGTGIFYNYNDYTLGMLTQTSAILDVDQSYQYNLYSNLFIMLASTIIMTVTITFLTHKKLLKKFEFKKEYSDELITSKRSLIFSLIFAGLGIAIIIMMLIPNFGGILLDMEQSNYIAMLFSPNSPFQNSFIYLFLIIATILGLVYGCVSKNFKNNFDFSLGFTKQFNNIGYLFILLFLSSILVGVINWTNIGVVIASKLMDLLVVLDFSGIALIITAVMFIVVMSIFIPSTTEKWVLISPLFIPLFMRANLTPDYAQFIFKISDSIGKVISPLFIYFIITIGFMKKYSDEEATLFGTLKKMLPTIILITLLWVLILISWHIVGLPLGIGAYTTM